MTDFQPQASAEAQAPRETYSTAQELRNQFTLAKADKKALARLFAHASVGELVEALCGAAYDHGKELRKSVLRIELEIQCVGHNEKLTLESLQKLCKAYRLNGLKKCGHEFVEDVFKEDRIELGKRGALAFLRELGLDGTMEHHLVERLIKIEARLIGEKGLEEKVEFLRAVGLCHAHAEADFSRILENITPVLPEILPRDMTRLLMGWAEVGHENDRACAAAIAHVADPAKPYAPVERAIALRCLSLLTDLPTLQATWDRISSTLPPQVCGAVMVSKELLRTITSSGLKIGEERARNVYGNSHTIPTPWIDQEILRKIERMTSRVGGNHQVRVRVGTVMAERTFEYRDSRFALVVDSPWNHRLGGFDDGDLCGSEILRNRTLLQAGYTVIRVDEDALAEKDARDRLLNLLRGQPRKEVHHLPLQH